ncbi:hypothetical protein [Streptomyces sp. NPDC014622]
MLKRRSCGGRPPKFDKDDYKRQHAVECVRYEATVLVTLINEWL